MTKTSLTKWLFALMLAMVLVLAACSDDTSSDDTDPDTEDPADSEDEGTEDEEEEPAEDDGLYSIDDFSMDKTNEGEAIEGGSITYGLVSDTVFEGVLNYNFYEGNPDYNVIAWFDEPLLDTDANYTYTNGGAAEYEISEDGKTFTLTIKDGVNWHDGEPVTAEDWAYSYEVIGHPEYTGVRYNGDFTNVVGMEEYHAGEADSISGIEIVDEKTLKITHHETGPSMVTGGIWTYAMPKHIFEDIPVAEMAESDAVRNNPIGMGPFKVDSIVPGESVVYKKNEDYWRGEPKLDEVVLKVVDPTVVVNQLETGGVDLVSSFPVDQFPDNADMSNVEYLGMIDNAYTYIGFKLGHWDEEAGENVMDPDAKMADVNLRKAMWHAVNNDDVGNEFYNGLRWNATTLIIPFFPDYHDETIETPTYDPEEAKRILEEAGYVDQDGDGMREDPEGEELVINFASMSGGDTAEPLAQYYIQSWAQVGLNVQLVDGRLLEFNTFYDRVEADDPGIDIYQGAWGTGTDVNPEGLYSNIAAYNYPRYASDENARLIAEGNSEKALDVEYRQQVYSEWQELMVEDIPVFPTLYRSILIPVNNRVLNYSIDPAKYILHEIAVSEEEAQVAE
ncbi:oligopeptide ABC transporter substrate-binding protein [Ornithinibacillus salinisoli]|uniref:Oligopeptide ABC transporter substrate-binding protein n=1 Tax=Ornithinibacillus salinisoli TaxID=1848459 RepID=A0ABW4W1Q0_9BACI